MNWRKSLFRLVTITTVVVGALLGVAGGPAMADPPRNVALNKPYTMEPKPNYGLTVDSTDNVKLTDGKYTAGYFWTQRATTVGWGNTSPVSITLDLQRVYSISGASFSTAAGVAGVTWPTSILVLVSEDGKDWSFAGDLAELGTREGTPRVDSYSAYRFRSDSLRARGRYVRLVVEQVPFTFVDEIEVYEGPANQTTKTSSGERIGDARELLERRRVVNSVLWRLRTDLAEARSAIERTIQLSPAERNRLLARVQSLTREVEGLSIDKTDGMKSILPLNDLHARVYGLYAPLDRARGLSGLAVWDQNRWDPLSPTQAPEGGFTRVSRLNVTLMRRETRSTVLNLTNTTDSKVDAVINVSGLPGGTNPAYLQVSEVLFTDTREHIPVATALSAIERASGGYSVSILPGMTRQIWFSFKPESPLAGGYEGQIKISTSLNDRMTLVPLMLQIYSFDFPALPDIHVGGWDYVQGKGAYDATQGNIAKLVELLATTYVDTPWGTKSVQPSKVTFSPDGHLTSIGFEGWDEWVAKWPRARIYAVFLNVTDKFVEEPAGTERFNRMVGRWINAWVRHMRDQSLRPEQLLLLLVDEPQSLAQAETVIKWANAIKVAEPRVTLYENPVYADPRAVELNFFSGIDILAPNLTMFMRGGELFQTFYKAQQGAGRQLWFLATSGPAKLLDPMAYYRGQFWWAIKYRAKGSFYWAFSDGGGASSWNAYLQKGTDYSPLFLSADGVTMSKHMAGISEGAQDYQYFVMLADRVSDMQRKRLDSPVLSQARQLLRDGPTEGLKDSSEKNLAWALPKDRNAMDRIRLQVLEVLDRLDKI